MCRPRPRVGHRRGLPGLDPLHRAAVRDAQGELVVGDPPADEQDAARDGAGVSHRIAHQLGEDDLDVVEEWPWQVLGGELAPDLTAGGAHGGRLVAHPQDVRGHVGLRGRVWGVHRASPSSWLPCRRSSPPASTGGLPTPPRWPYPPSRCSKRPVRHASWSRRPYRDRRHPCHEGRNEGGQPPRRRTARSAAEVLQHVGRPVGDDRVHARGRGRGRRRRGRPRSRRTPRCRAPGGARRTAGGAAGSRMATPACRRPAAASRPGRAAGPAP